MKTLFRIAIAAVLLGAAIAWARPSAFRGDRFVVGDAESMRSLTIDLDSLGTSGDNDFIFTTPRGMLILGASTFSKSVFNAANLSDSAKATVKLKSGATIFTHSVDSGDVHNITRAAYPYVHFDSNVVCTVAVLDGTGGADGTGGLDAQVVFWWNDDYTNR